MYFLISTFAILNLCLIPYYCMSNLEYIIRKGLIPFINYIYKIKNIKKRLQIKINYYDDNDDNDDNYNDLEKKLSDSDEYHCKINNNLFKLKKIDDIYSINNSNLINEDIMIIDDKYSIIVE